MKSDKQITFRRIRGRIVPIKLKDLAKDRGVQKGVGLIAAGVGATTVAGIGAAGLVKKAAAFRIRGNDVWKINERVVKSMSRRAAELRGTSIQLRALRKPVLGLGGVIGGALIGTGAAYLMNSKTLQKRFSDEDRTNAAVSLTTTGALLTGLAYYKSLGLTWKGAKEYAQAAVKGTTHLLKKVPIKSSLGPLIFKKL